MGRFLRLPMRRGSTRPWVGTVTNARTGDPIDLRLDGTTMRFAATHGGVVLIEKTYGIDGGPGGITVAGGAPGNVYEISWAQSDTLTLAPDQLSFAVQVVEPDEEGDEPVYGVLALSGP